MNFLKNEKNFSFKLGGKNAWDLDYSSETTCIGNEIITVYYFSCGIKITNIAKKYEEFDAYEWVNYIENISENPSEIISDFWDCDCSLPLKFEEDRIASPYYPDTKKATKIYSPTGSVWSKKDFACDDINAMHGSKRIYHIYPNETREYFASDGRSSEKKAPFFNVHKDKEGYIFAIGWTGQWKSQISRENDSIHFKSKIEDTYFRLMPKEKIRTSSIVIMSYQGDVIDSHNKWRRLLKKHFSLVGNEGRDSDGPLCAGIWGGMKTQSVLKRIEAIKENRLPFEYLWMDAGWYGADTEPSPDEFTGDWWNHTGDWCVSHLIHPNGLKDVSKAVHNAGMKFLLWFEPERTAKTSQTAKEHPYYFLPSKADVYNLLLDLGNEKAWNYCFETLSKLIEELNIDCYRQDFNFSPLSFWRENDKPDRKGITEIKHINGLYRLWDELLKKFPNLIIDNCASGGRRIDIETLRRSIPLWRSDYQCPANYDEEASQCHNQSFNLWMPYSGTGGGRSYDEYRIRSAYSAALTTNYFYSEREMICETKEKTDFIRKYTNEYLKVRPYFSEDFYPLTELSETLDTWCAMQFNRPSRNDGIIEIFRREEAPYETATFILRGLDKSLNYLFTDADGGEFTLSGKELSEKGFKITLPDRHKAKIYFYKSL